VPVAAAALGLKQQPLVSSMACVMPGSSGGGGQDPPGGGPGKNPLPSLDEVSQWLENQEEEEDEEEWKSKYQGAPTSAGGQPGLRECHKCHFITFLRKGGCANPGCVSYLVQYLISACAILCWRLLSPMCNSIT
jgi:hypothetical protein